MTDPTPAVYATRADLESRFGAAEVSALLRYVKADASPEEQERTLADALSDASREVDERVGARYGVPLASPGERIVGLVCDIARYRLAKDRATEEIAQRYKDAVSALTAIGAGRSALLGAGGQTVPPRDTDLAATVASRPAGKRARTLATTADGSVRDREREAAVGTLDAGPSPEAQAPGTVSAASFADPWSGR